MTKTCLCGAGILVFVGACGGESHVVHDTLPETASAETLVADDAQDGPDADGGGDAHDATETPAPPPDREPGEPAARTARCDDIEPLRCLLPWPSNAFVTLDSATPTGLRIEIANDILPADERLDLVRGDGFSRVTPIVMALPVGAPRGSETLRAFNASPGPSFGAEVALNVVRVQGRDRADPDVLVGYPLAPLPAATEHIVISQGITDEAGLSVSPGRPTEVALGLTAPTSEAEARTRAHFAPARAVLAGRAIDLRSVTHLWDFTTRSTEDPLTPLRQMAEAAKADVASGRATVTDLAAIAHEPPIAAIVTGRLEGLSDPVAGGTLGVPFRVVVPSDRGSAGDYRVVMYGHGTGGDVGDSSYDELIASHGAAKVGVEIDGWTGATLTSSVSGLLVPIPGTDAIVVRMRRSLAGIAAIQQALVGPLGDVLAAESIANMPNPAAGRRPLRFGTTELDTPIWAGGSLGGVTGMVYGHLEPTIAGGLLNVPGAAFTHWLGQSSISDLLSIALTSRYPAMVDQQIAAAMSQSIWDEVDGAVWAKSRTPQPIFLVQMSVGDPVMPNLGTAMVATALDALQLVPDGEHPLVSVFGLAEATEAIGRTALTEFRTDATSATGIHGFAATDRPAGIAARSQLTAFIESLWAGSPVIKIPDECSALVPAGICDFTTP